jgi:hypothetical protein
MLSVPSIMSSIMVSASDPPTKGDHSDLPQSRS